MEKEKIERMIKCKKRKEPSACLFVGLLKTVIRAFFIYVGIRFISKYKIRLVKSQDKNEKKKTWESKKKREEDKVENEEL